MSLVSTTAFILRLDPLSEKDVAAALLTKDHGVVRAAVKGARGKTRRGAALQILTEVAVTYFRKEGAELARLDGVEIVRSAFGLAQKPETAMLLPYLAESAQTFVPESELTDEVYRLVRHVLDALEDGVNAGLAARYFEVWLLRFAGLLPDEKTCAVCGEPLAASGVRFDVQIPGFVSEECAAHGAVPVSPAARALVTAIRRAKLTEWPAGSTPKIAVLDELEHLAREIRRGFLGHELKSYRFLKSLS